MTMFESSGDIANRPVNSVANNTNATRDTKSKVQRLMNFIGK